VYQTPERRRRSQNQGALVLSTILIVFLAWGLVHPMWRAHRARDWRETTCEITDYERVPYRDRSGDEHLELVVAYDYEVGGVTYQNDDVDFTVARDASRERIVANAETGARLPCWYDPDDPEDSVLVRTGWAQDGWAWPLFIMFVGGAALFVGLLRSDRTDAVGLLMLAPRATLAGMLVVVAYCSRDAGAGDAAAYVLAIVASAGSVWTGLGVRRWRAARRNNLPSARIQSQ
jgi:hypothetical protein